jgi:hypothetical protein
MFTSIMSRPNVRIDRGMTLATTTETTPSLSDLLWVVANQEPYVISRSALQEFFPSLTIMRTKAAATGHHKLRLYLPWRPWQSLGLSPITIKYKVVTFIYSQMPGAWRLISSKNFGKRSPLIPRIKERVEETKAAGKHIKIHWIQVHWGITENEKANELL